MKKAVDADGVVDDSDVGVGVGVDDGAREKGPQAHSKQLPLRNPPVHDSNANEAILIFFFDNASRTRFFCFSAGEEGKEDLRYSSRLL